MNDVRLAARRRGTVLAEFMLMGIPLMFMVLGVFEVSILMWRYITMAQTAQQAALYVSVHGNTCTQNGNTCTITVANIASYIEKVAVGLPPSNLNITLACTGCTSVSCAPLNSCNGNSDTFPPLSYNAIGNNVTVTAAYAMTNPLYMFWNGKNKVAIQDLTLGATSTQRIVY